MASFVDVPLISLQASNLARFEIERAGTLTGGITLGCLFVEGVELQHGVVVGAAGEVVHVLLRLGESGFQIRHTSPLLLV